MQKENSRLLKKWIIVAIVYAVLLLAILLIANIGPLNRAFWGLMRILRPVIIGLIISAFCNPIFRFFERRLFLRMRPQGLRRAISLTCAYLTMLLVLALLVVLILPQLSQSISFFAQNYNAYLTSAIEQVNLFIGRLNGFVFPYLGENLFPPLEGNVLKQVLDHFFTTEESGILSLLQSIDIMQIFNAITQTFSFITDFILGLFVSIYLLSSKEKRSAQVMKFRRAMFDGKTNAFITRVIATVGRSFGGFLNGKILDSLIIGILTYIVISIFGIPYAILISTIVGITNIIPVVGPFVGAIPSAVIIFATRPDKVLLFILIIFIIQQIDGNIIGPKILGDNTKVSPLCVIIAVTVMGSLWGFVGMILGVPLFATVLEILELSIIDRLQRKGLPSGLGNYYASDTAVDQVRDSNVADNTIETRLKKHYLHVQKTISKDASVSIPMRQKLAYHLYRFGCKLRLFTGPDEDLLIFSATQEALADAKAASDERLAAELEAKKKATADASGESTPNV